MWAGHCRELNTTTSAKTGRSCIYIANRNPTSRSAIAPSPLPMVAPSPEITDIRSSTVVDMRKAIVSSLKCSPPTLPTLVLYDEPGLKLFEKITYLEEYYLTNCEIEILKTKSDEIAKRLNLKEGGIVVELGSGNLRKTTLLLDALERLGLNLTYYALDLDRKELVRSLEGLTSKYSHVEVAGLLGTYDDGIAALKRLTVPKTIFWLGSSVANMDREDSAAFLQRFPMNPGDSWVIGIDRRKDAFKVWRAYNDSQGVTREFELNGLLNANKILGSEEFKEGDWEYVGEYDAVHGRHQAWYVPLKDVTVCGVEFKEGERILVEQSYKYGKDEVDELWERAGVVEVGRWSDSSKSYDVHVVSVPPFYFSRTRTERQVPSLEEWNELWKAWDLVTLEMIPKDLLQEKPILLRHPCIFYIGHIPTFLDIHLTRVTTKKPTPPAYYTRIFERGIDPDMGDPTQCHPHSEVPNEWPTLPELLDFRDRVRERLRSLYDGRAVSQATKRAVWLGFEHEVMHLETLLYMLLQSPKTRPPTYVPIPDWKEMATRGPKPMIDESARWQYFPGGEISVGLDDDEDDSVPDDRFFGWDNENPRRQESVKPFLAAKRPITNGEYALFLQHTNGEAPPSWTGKSPNWSIKTVFGPVPLRFATDWPVMASYEDLNAYARWKGGRLPTEGELRLMYDYLEMKDAAAKRSAVTIDAVNGHLTQNGVNTTPPDGSCESASSSRNGTDGTEVKEKQPSNGDTNGTLSGRLDIRGSGDDVFVNTLGKNIGLRHWHPTPLPAANKLSTGSHGGAWEWTSTTFDKHDGWKKSSVYPGYSSDFFDTKHKVVLGGSWATLPRVAGRRTFRNWYQSGYGYVWAGGRVIKDLAN